PFKISASSVILIHDSMSFLSGKIWIINESVSYFNEFRPLDCFVATLLATTVPKIVPYREIFG
ncbi:TPA: hypothetical protein ACT9CC_002625, partial [Legionella pneumophila]